MAAVPATFGALLVVFLAAQSAVGYREDPEVHMDAIQLITSKGYPAERHFVTTSDGYILQMHRIPYSPKHAINISRGVFFLQHGVLGCSTNWLTNLVNESLAFILSDAGYDVWMGNVRGNTYSRNHTHLTVHDKAFWNFTFDQHALIDMPTMLTKVIDVTGQQRLFYVGHSQGTIMGFAGFTANQSLSSHIKVFFALAPVTTVQYIKGPITLLSPFTGILEYILDTLGAGEFLPNEEFVDILVDFYCSWDEKDADNCRDVLFLLCGFDPANINTTRIPVYLSHNPAGTSVKNVVHYNQEYLSGKFRKYDYGTAGNMEEYGTPSPPPYNVTQLTIPTAIFTGGNDWLADPKDVDNLIPKISHVMINHTYVASYEHLDFIWGLNAPELIYSVLMELARKYS
ncbi:Gastric triacylglycerol lipase [Geodia barretti]|uniref:Lipase n=2 Tax=Geodia barretti TaxID=519541 RepID=A0AA35WZ50_GEOBA|nr:Gastric triacylglycerol lipase [Geodia barretti]